MEYLEQKRFNCPQELCDWTNKNEIRVISVATSHGDFTLFYKKILK